MGAPELNNPQWERMRNGRGDFAQIDIGNSSEEKINAIKSSLAENGFKFETQNASENGRPKIRVYKADNISNYAQFSQYEQGFYRDKNLSSLNNVDKTIISGFGKWEIDDYGDGNRAISVSLEGKTPSEVAKLKDELTKSEMTFVEHKGRIRVFDDGVKVIENAQLNNDKPAALKEKPKITVQHIAGKPWPSTANPIEALEYLIAAREYIAEHPTSENYIQAPHSDDRRIVGGNIRRPALLDASYTHGPSNRILLSISFPLFVETGLFSNYDDKGGIYFPDNFNATKLGGALQNVLASQGIKYNFGTQKVGRDNIAQTIYIEATVDNMEQYEAGRKIIQQIVHGDVSSDKKLFELVEKSTYNDAPHKEFSSQEKEVISFIKEKSRNGTFKHITVKTDIGYGETIYNNAYSFELDKHEAFSLKEKLKNIGIESKIKVSDNHYTVLIDDHSNMRVFGHLQREVNRQIYIENPEIQKEKDNPKIELSPVDEVIVKQKWVSTPSYDSKGNPAGDLLRIKILDIAPKELNNLEIALKEKGFEYTIRHSSSLNGDVLEIHPNHNDDLIGIINSKSHTPKPRPNQPLYSSVLGIVPIGPISDNGRPLFGDNGIANNVINDAYTGIKKMGSIIDLGGKIGSGFTALGASTALQSIEQALKTGKQEDILNAVMATSTAIVDVAEDLGKLAKFGRFGKVLGPIGNILSGGATIYSAFKTGDSERIGEAIGGTVLGTIAGIAGGVIATGLGVVGAPAIAVVVGVATVATVVGEKIGGPVAEMIDGKISVTQGFQKLGTNATRLVGDVVDAAGKLVTGVGEGAKWIGSKIEQGANFVGGVIEDGSKYFSNGIKDYAKNAGSMQKPLEALAAGVEVTGQIFSETVKNVGKINNFVAGTVVGGAVKWTGDRVSDLGHGISDVMESGIKAVVRANAFVVGAVSKVGGAVAELGIDVVEKTSQTAVKALHNSGLHTAAAVVETASKKVVETAKAAKEYVSSAIDNTLSFFGYEEEKPVVKKPTQTNVKPALQAQSKHHVELSEKVIEKQLENHLHILEEKGWSKRIGNGDNNINLDELKRIFAKNGVKLKDIDKDGDGNITGKEITDILVKLPKDSPLQRTGASR
jgi:hypothetical protein